MFFTSWLVVSKDDQWSLVKVRSQPSLMQFVFLLLFNGNVLCAELIDTIFDDITIVTCLLSSKPNVLVPFGVQVFITIKNKIDYGLIIVHNKWWWNGLCFY